jgi:hypothetical protein
VIGYQIVYWDRGVFYCEFRVFFARKNALGVKRENGNFEDFFYSLPDRGL